MTHPDLRVLARWILILPHVVTRSTAAVHAATLHPALRSRARASTLLADLGWIRAGIESMVLREIARARRT